MIVRQPENIPSPSDRIPIVIINWNGISDTMECIESVLQTRGIEFFIYLIDNGSAQGEGLKLAEYYKGNSLVHVVGLPKNIGFTKANNLALEELLKEEYQYISLLNNDTVVDPSWLLELKHAAESEHAQVVSSKLIRYHDRTKLDNVGHQMLNTGEIIPIGHGESPDRYQVPLAHFGSCAAGTLYEADMLRKIGCFDTFFSTGYEDAELGARAVIAGHRCVLAPKAIVYHKIGQSVGKIFSPAYATMIQESIWYTFFKLMPWTVILSALPFIISKIVALTFLNVITWRLGHIRIMWSAIAHTAGQNASKIRSARKAFSRLRSRSSWEILSRQRFFLAFDLQRFVRIYIRRNPSSFDSYGSG